MDNTIYFHYYDKYNRKIVYRCKKRDFWASAMLLLEKIIIDIDKKLYYTENNITKQLDYYNLGIFNAE